jgi:hypothetical protein
LKTLRSITIANNTRVNSITLKILRTVKKFNNKNFYKFTSYFLCLSQVIKSRVDLLNTIIISKEFSVREVAKTLACQIQSKNGQNYRIYSN